MNKAQQTRKYILEKAYNLIYFNGYQATSIDRILETSRVTKGAFYYHFRNKEDMAIAMLKVMVFPQIKNGLVLPLDEIEDPLEAIHKTLSDYMLNRTRNEIFNGCPFNNLIQEMSAINETFRETLMVILNYWEKAIVKTLQRAVDKKQISDQHNLVSIAQYIIAGFEGIRGTAKLYRTKNCYENFLLQLRFFLYSL